jgi:hypothetical protein
MRPARTPPSTFLFLPIQLSNSKAAKRPDNRSGQRPKRETRKGLNPQRPQNAEKPSPTRPSSESQASPGAKDPEEIPKKRKSREAKSAPAAISSAASNGDHIWPHHPSCQQKKSRKSVNEPSFCGESVSPGRPSGRGAGSLPHLSPLSPGAPQGDRRSPGPGAVRAISREEKHTTLAPPPRNRWVGCIIEEYSFHGILFHHGDTPRHIAV